MKLRSHAIWRMLAMTAAIGATTGAQAATLVVLNKSEANVSLIDPASGDVTATIPVGVGPHEAATSPDGNTVVVCNYGQREPGHTLSVIDLPSKQVVKTIDLGENTRPHGIVYLDDTTITVTTEGSKKLLIVDVAKGEITSAIDTDQDISHMVAVTPDHKWAFVANIRSGSASIIDLPARKLEKIIAIDERVQSEGVAAHPTRPEVWLTNRRGNTISIISTDTLEVTQEIDCGEFPIRVTFTPDGAKALVSCGTTADVAIFDVASRQALARVPMEIDESELKSEGRLFGQEFANSPMPVGILVEPTGKLAYVANTNADIITVIDIEQQRIVDRLKAGAEPDGMTWSDR